MTIKLNTKDGDEFYKNSGCLSMWFDYMNEIFDSYEDIDVEKFIKSHNTFVVSDDNDDVGFGIFKVEKAKDLRALILLEFYIKPKFRSIKRFLSIRNHIIKYLKNRHFTKWSCLVETKETKKVNAYERIGFKPLFQKDCFTFMEMDLGV